MDTMTNSLPEWVEKWIDENEAEVRHEVMYIDAIPTFKVRALLSHYRLCEREAVAVRGRLPVDAPLYAEAKEAK